MRSANPLQTGFSEGILKSWYLMELLPEFTTKMFMKVYLSERNYVSSPRLPHVLRIQCDARDDAIKKYRRYQKTSLSVLLALNGCDDNCIENVLYRATAAQIINRFI
jgi:hypothetical protein